MKQENCFICQDNEQLIKKFKFWKVILNLNQYYLGGIIIALNEHKEDFLETTQEERRELFQIMKKITNVLKELFEPNLFNYAILMNQEKHLHMHLIPRYKNERIFENIVFKDENYGHNPFSHNEFKISNENFNKIKEKIKNQLENGRNNSK